jgi:hypothetical protein
MRHTIAAILLCTTATQAFAISNNHPCAQSYPRGSLSDSATPDQNLQCQSIGLAFCIIEESRLDNLPKDVAVGRAADWYARLGGTGSHKGKRNAAQLAPIGDFVYGHEKMPPWSAYWYSVYSCGFDKRVPPEQAKAASPKWDAAALGCVHDHPGNGDGSANDALRICLESAMNKIVGDAKTHQGAVASPPPRAAGKY